MKKFLLIAAFLILFSTQGEAGNFAFCAKERTGSCLQCLDTFTLKNGNCKCGTNLSPETPGATYVDSIVSPNQCRSCSAYFPITGGRCSKCGRRWEAGWKCYTWTCNSGYYTVGGISCKANGCCKPCSSISVSNGTCTACAADGSACTSATCSAGYAWNGSSCARLNCAAGQYVNGNSCAACPSGQWSKGGTATSCSPCSSISVSNGTCTACSSTGTCTAVSCNSGYTANGTKCEKVSCSGRTPEAMTQGDGSIKCSCTATSCGTGAKCAKHPAYNSKTKQNNYSVCVCQSGYYDDGESCSSCDDGCSTCSGPGACTVCKEGYSLSGGRCVPCPPNCATCDANGSCSQCSSGYLENNGACLKCEADVNLSGNNCVRYCNLAASGYSDTVGDVQNVCLWASCYTGNVWGTTKVYFAYSANSNRYVLDHYYCCPENCAECSDWGQCTTCNDGYTLQDGACVAGCDQYDVGNGTCTECDSSGCTDAECNGTNAYFDPAHRKCGVECDVNQYLDASYTCQDCPAGQTSTGGWLTTPTNCYSCGSIPVDGGTCTECQDGVCTKARCENGYVLDASGTACIAARATCSSPLKISDDGCCCVK